MAQEIERKYLVTSDCYKTVAVARYHIRQGYISREKTGTVRIRITDNQAFLTIKGKPATGHFARYEWEKEISLQEAQELMRLCEPGMIDKTRFLVKSGKHIFEVDEFYGENEGLTIAEVELESVDESYEKPDFIGEEVTGDVRYYNSFLMKNPFTRW